MRIIRVLSIRRGRLTLGSIALAVAGATLLGLSWNSGWNWERITATVCLAAAWFTTWPTE